jgi:hypothetical protein
LKTGTGSELPIEEGADLGNRESAVLFAERVMEESGEGLDLLGARTEAIEECLGRSIADDPIGAGEQNLSGDSNGSGVVHQAVGSFI